MEATKKHGRYEYGLTTVQEQLLHFYEGGRGKLSSNKSFEIYSGHLQMLIMVK